ncbi:hypothetical protein L209DRAFT_481932 [Thermothelomyces heterothallicus CBS 203.75]
MTRAERLAKHAEEQRRLWQSAEAPDDPPFLPTMADQVPLTMPFKTPIKVLSRKPAPQVLAKRDPVTGLEQLTLKEDEDDEGEEKKQQPQESPEEIRKRQQRELEEKQRRYEEARAKIFGDSNPSSGQSSPRTGTPPSGGGGEGRQGHRGRGRGRGGRGRDQDNSRQDRRQQNNQQPGATRELFDPGYSPKPGFNLQKRGDSYSQSGTRSNIPREEDQVIRAPRGPDGSGRGGFGFARRGRELG